MRCPRTAKVPGDNAMHCGTVHLPVMATAIIAPDRNTIFCMKINKNCTFTIIIGILNGFIKVKDIFSSFKHRIPV
jgi:hypothetical protein